MAAKKTNTANNTENTIVLPDIDIKYLTVRIVGDSPLIVHRWSEKAKKEMLDKQMKKATAGKDAKNPMRDFLDAMYWLDESGNAIDTPSELKDVTMDTPHDKIEEVISKGRFGFPACAFKACAINAGYQQGVIAKKTTARGAFHVIGEFAVIKGDIEMREDMVQIGGISRVADIRYRPEFRNWETTLSVRYNAKAITAEQIVNLLNYGGFSNGVGEWRPEKDGSFGTFHVEGA